MVLHKVQLPCQTIFFGSNAVNIFPESREAFNFARDIAELKGLEGDNQPFFVMDVDRVSMLVDEWFSCLPRVQPYYSVNCNADPVLLQVLAKHPSVGFHCITRENLDFVTGIAPPERILYANPCWTRGALRYANQAGIQTLSFDSTQSLDRILNACPDAELILNVCLDPMVEDSNAALGCNLEDAPELLQLAATLGANVIGIGFNIGSGCREAALYTAAIEVSANLIRIARTFGLEMKILNIGGGFANSYFHNQDQFATFADVCHTINEALDYFFPEDLFPSLKIIAKPGRFFAAPSFSLITNIIGRDCVDASQVTNDEFDAGNEAFIYRINDGYYGSFGCRVVANCEPQCAPLFASDADNHNSEHFYGSICGPTRDEFDVVQQMCRFRQMEPGDWLLWTNMGAYSMNSCGSLDETSETPVVYYFATLAECQKINGNFSDLKNEVFSMDQITVTDDHRACSPSLMSVSSEDDMRSVTSEESNMPDEETADDLWRLLWPLYECVGK
jgi:ornithine decarboxylase